MAKLNPLSTARAMLLACIPAFFLFHLGAAAQCKAKTISPAVAAPWVAEGFMSKVVANNFEYPRGMLFDTEGNLLVVDSGRGIEAITFEEMGGPYGDCLEMKSRKMVVENSNLNHGIALSPDGKTLYASTKHRVFSWDYDASKMMTTSDRRVIVRHLGGSDHTTRTLLLSDKMPGMLLVSRGSFANIDPAASDISSGHSQIKAFNLNNMTDKPYFFNDDGMLLGWGLRNDVGMAEEPSKGGIYSVENSVDEMKRNGVDVHGTNPGEELNFLGYLDGTHSPNLGSNFGYPECFAAWDTSIIPQNKGLEVGMQFAIGGPKAQKNDAMCRNERTAPSLVFEAHMAPLDIKFNDMGSEAWITFHGSWNRPDPAGYKVSMVRFADGAPVEKSTSRKAAVDIVANRDNSKCPEKCFRPVGLAWDRRGRLFFSSDQTGEVYVIARPNAPINTFSSTAVGTPTDTNGADSPQDTGAAVPAHHASSSFGLLIGALVAAILSLG